MSSLKDTVKDIFLLGVGGWADSQIADRYYVNDPTPRTGATAWGSYASGTGQFGVSVPPIVWMLGIGVAAVLLLRR
jgi:hypothetical protein